MTTGKNSGRSGSPTPAVVGIARSMRARDVSRPRPAERRARKENRQDPESGKGGNSPADS
jgi:hypothetical protein